MPEARRLWEDRIAAVRAGGLEAIADTVMGRYFSDAFRASHPETVAAFRKRLVSTDAEGYIGCCRAVMEVDTLDRLPQLRIPALVIAGELDQGTPVAMSEAVAAKLGAKLTVLAGASQTFWWTAVIIGFLTNEGPQSSV